MNGHGPKRSAIVLYGTETGTSQDLAEEVGRCLERLHFTVDVVGFHKVSFEVLHAYTLTAFVIATTGQGDFPSNAHKFWTSLLRKKLGTATLADIQYALVGLGDSSYPKFNWAARKLDKRLKQLGAEEILGACEADEQGDEGTDGAFLAWVQRFRAAVLGEFPLNNRQAPIPENEDLPSKWALQATDDAPLPSGIEVTMSNVVDHTNGFGESSDKFDILLEKNERVTPAEHWQDVRILRFRNSMYLEYLPGDSLAISPENMPQDVNTLLILMKWQDIADTPFTIVPNALYPSRSLLSHLSAPLVLDDGSVTLRELLTKHLDINAIPRRSFFSAIAKYTNDSMHKERLLEFMDPQYLDEYYDYATRPRRSIIEILQEFNTVNVPWQEAINVFPVLRPRQFSIASSGMLKSGADGNGGTRGTAFELLVAIVKYKTILRRVREGICSRYLAQLSVGTKINVELKREGRFAAKADISTTNHLLIGAGTGIAPLRSLIHEKSATNSTTSTTLIFGARNAEADYFFRDEWSCLQHTVLDVHTAFSRDQRGKVYVQDKIREQRQKISSMLHDPHTAVIVCGASGQMPKAVRQALVDVLSGGDGHDSTLAIKGQMGMSSIHAEQLLAKMEKEGRYKQETWS